MTRPNEGPLSPDRRMPYLIESDGNAGAIEDYLAAHRGSVMQRLTEHGAVLFRGFGTASAEAFGTFIQALGIEPLEYVYRSTPRTRQGKGFYTATEYPADREIPMHNENSYQRIWPRKLAFCCVKPAEAGGATPLADMLEVQRQLDPSIVEKFQQLGVRYDRVFHGNIDLSWQEVFQTDQFTDVEEFCALNEIQYEWLEDDVLKTSQINPGVVRHPARQENFLFNQAHLFHPSALGEETLNFMLDAFGPDLLPRNAYYGNGEAIEPDTLQQIRAAFDAAAVDIHWQAGDIALIDNIQVAHGRRTYCGERKLLASLLESNQTLPRSAAAGEALAQA
ncbi:TauD/TfdA family dioxygenase [Dyella flagellata]|uniref:Syringomycin biosynthesis enzyme n=1 Tax=Dyella flagellata TaxID=1867833 RepID=A0ABQ5X852_9GAMM|nr:TauD/TfdA family dioxygenase [Dyella flagellata]GLQ87768.1 syringomycin biosynthesis enzyme [Dyella flagellata]